MTGLFEHVLEGLAAAARQEPELASVAVDSWAVDYGLMKNGALQGEPFHYRDARTARGIDAVHEHMSSEDLYAATGLQRLPFNTIYQLADDKLAGRLERIDHFLLIPDLVTYWLTGRQFAERTNASTTALFNVHTGEWDDALIERVGLPRDIFPELVSAGSAVGGLLPAIGARVGFPALAVSTVGSHDTASAVVAVPATEPDFAYISSGTWALVGVELDRPVLTEASRLANFTNEGGVDGRVRYLRNVMGLWILNESIREWGDPDVVSLLGAAAVALAPDALFDVDDSRFLPPGDMPARIGEWYAERVLVQARAQGLVTGSLESLRSIIAATFAPIEYRPRRSVRQLAK